MVLSCAWTDARDAAESRKRIAVAAAGHTQDAAEAKALGRRPGTQAQEAGAGSKIRTMHARMVR